MNRKLFYILAALYAAGLVCGLIVLARRPKPLSTAQSLPSAMFQKDTVAVVEIYGPIYISQKTARFGISNDADRVVKKLHRIAENKDIKAVVLRINSPGGSVAATQEICREVKLLRKNGKIVVASLGDIAASGGYYIASQADRIIADRGTLTGSIGVILQFANVQELFKKVGVKIETVRSGNHKDIGSPFRELTKDEREILQALITDAYDQFVDAVADGRKMDKEKLLPLADGRIYTGTQAKANGLIDDFGNSMEAIDLAAKLAKITSRPRIVYDTDRDPFSQIMQLLGETSEIKLFSQPINSNKIRLDYILE